MTLAPAVINIAEIIAAAMAKVKLKGSTNAAATKIDSPVMAAFNGRVMRKREYRVRIEKKHIPTDFKNKIFVSLNSQPCRACPANALSRPGPEPNRKKLLVSGFDESPGLKI
jgi:hypothetical protein